MRVARVDRIVIHLDAEIPTDHRGYAQIWGKVITADQVLEYGPADGFDGAHFELVPESTVFDDEANATLLHAPVTFLHPQEPVTADNSGRLSVGHIIELERRGDEQWALHQVEDSSTLDKIAGGTVELSPGYTVELDETPGTTADGIHYDATQSGRRYNHQAIVPMARAGADNRLSIDAGVIPADGLRVQVGPKTTMKTKFVIDGKMVEVDAEQLTKVQALLGELGVSMDEGDDEDDSTDAADDEPKDGDGKTEDAEGDPDEDEDEDATSNDAKDGKAPVDVAALTDAITRKVTDEMSRKFDAERKAALDSVRVRGKLVADARGGLPASYVYEGQTDRQIMIDAIKARDPDFAARAAKLTDAELPGAFQSALARGVKSPADVIKSDAATGKRRTMADAIDLQARRQRAAQDCDEAGQFVAKHADVRSVKYAQGGN